MLCRTSISALRRGQHAIKLGVRAYTQQQQTAYADPWSESDSRLEVVEKDTLKRLSRRWNATGGITTGDHKKDDPTALLIKAGFIRQAHAGIFQLLPTASQQLDGIKSKLRFFLKGIDAEEVSLSALSSEQLWRQSGRIGEKPLKDVEHQFLTVCDRKNSGFILSPTHEEEITRLVSDIAKSYKDYPLRIYQITRKYRDELRPRHGLLRTKEFTMKDLYTFDITEEAALKTYEEVRKMYRQFFELCGFPIIEARATSGDMGGSLSHEFHIISDIGEDTVHVCQSCGYAENDEVSQRSSKGMEQNLPCPQCHGTEVTKHNAIEVGHTFHLGTRYSEPLGAYIEVPTSVLKGGKTEAQTGVSQRVPLQMGCHGIGVSRLIGAAAAVFADKDGLRWPVALATETVRIIVPHDGSDTPGAGYITQAINNIARRLSPKVMPLHAWLDDRKWSIRWKMDDARLLGIPIVVILGRDWKATGLYEIRCRTMPELHTKSSDLLGSLCAIMNKLDPANKNEEDMWHANVPPGVKEELRTLHEKQIRAPSPTRNTGEEEGTGAQEEPSFLQSGSGERNLQHLHIGSRPKRAADTLMPRARKNRIPSRKSDAMAKPTVADPENSIFGKQQL